MMTTIKTGPAVSTDAPVTRDAATAAATAEATGPDPNATRPDANTTVPRHIGIIMDGNGRWATKRGLPRTKGHQAGTEAAKRVVLEAIQHNVRYLTLYAFSTENWRRTEEEVSFLMALVARNLRSQYDFYRRNNVRVAHVGNLDGLPPEVRREIAKVTRETEGNTAITVTLAVNYGGRDEIVRAVNRWIHDGGSQHLHESDLARYLDRPDTPDPDLIVRTAGEQRISNFLLWEGAYAELFFSPRLWPEWTGDDLRGAIEFFQGRKRNFGGMR